MANVCHGQVSDTNAIRYIKVPQGYLMVLKAGDTIIAQLKHFAKKENIPGANFTGMGLRK